MIKNDGYDLGMTSLGKLVQGFGLTIEPLPSFDLEALVADINTLAVTASVDQPLGTMNAIRASVLGWIYQDDDAHDTCGLTACLNPLHPGPCKKWKSTLHAVAPGAWKQIETARVEKANAKRVAKIADLKAQGKPIPKKLLTPIVAKTHPDAGKTAGSATGEAHTAGKAINDSSGVKPSTPVKLGTDATAAKGPKGKKPTVASKGVAAVIAQEKVTPQYKLDKAAAITEEQWRGLSTDEQAVIRGELAKIQKDGFGPQQKKATDLLEKLNKKPEPKAPEKPSATPGKTTLGQATKKVSAPAGGGHSGAQADAVKAATAGTTDDVLKTAAKLTPEDLDKLDTDDKKKILSRLSYVANHPKAKAGQKKQANDLLDKLVPVGGKAPEKAAPAAKAATPPKPATAPAAKAPVKLGDKEPAKAPPGPDAKTEGTTKAQASAMIALADAIPGVKAGSLADADKLNMVVDKLKESGGKLTDHPKMKLLVDKLAQSALKQATADNMPGLGHGANDVGISEFNREIAAHIEQGKPGLPPLVAKMVKHHEASKSGNVKQGIEKAAADAAAKKAAPPAVAPKPAPAKIENATAKAADVPAHVKHAVDMAHGKALGATWSKNHLAAYEKLTPDDFHTLDADTQDKIVAELKKGEAKFLDPKKVQATKDLLAKFGKGKSTDTTPKAPAPLPPAGPADFHADMNNHSVSATEAKKAVDGASVAQLADVAKKVAGLSDTENPDHPDLGKNTDTTAAHLLDAHTKLYGPEVTGQPAVKTAMADYKQAMANQLYAAVVGDAKKKAFNKVSGALYADGSPKVTVKLSPMEKAALQRYQKHLLAHPVKSDTADIDALDAKTKAAKKELDAQLQAALKKANAPKPEDMTSAQLSDHVFELLNTPEGPALGEDATAPALGLSLAETQSAKKLAAEAAKQHGSKYSAAVLADPTVAAKLHAVESAASQYMMTGYATTKLNQHVAKYHDAALASGKNAKGDPLTAADKQIIKLHKEKLLKDHSYLSDLADKQLVAMNKAASDFEATAEAAAKPAPVKLSGYDQATISEAYTNAWSKTASKAALYGTTGISAHKVAAHSLYPAFTQDLNDLKTLSGKVALAHAESTAAHLNVPTDPDTGHVLVSSPEWDAWQSKIHAQQALEKDFNDRLASAQKKLDTIRTAAGLKKRALPKIDAPAVKAAAAESAYFKTGGYSGPNYGKPSSAKAYLASKLGSKLGVAHQTPNDKKLGKLADAAPPPTTSTPSTPKIKNAGTSPVSLGGGDSIASIPDPIKGTILSNFKGMPSGKYLADPPEDIFGNLVNLAAAYGKDVPGGLSVDQVLKTIDEKHSKSLGVANAHMMEKKITDWLGTGAGKAYAQAHSTPDSKVVKQLTGELDLPKGITLAPGQKVQDLAGPGKFDKSIPESAFFAATSPQATKLQNEYMAANGIKWSAKQKAALKRYTGNGMNAYTGMNNWLRGDGSFGPNVKQDVIDIQSAMIPMPQHMLLKRGTGWPPDIASFSSHPEDLVGKTFEDKGFMSTSVAGAGGHFSGHQLQLTIEAPAGTPAAFIQGLSQYGGENEMLLAAGLQYRVISVTKVGGKTQMRVRVVGIKTNEASS
jgi:hypothetical protein